MPALPLFFTTRWHTYQWAKYGPLYAPQMFTAFTIQQVSQRSAQIALVPGPGGQWKALYSRRSGDYDMASAWVQCQAGIGSAANLYDLVPNTPYFVNVVLDGYLPNSPKGLPLSGCYYTDELSFTTLAVPPPNPVISAVVATPGAAGSGNCTVTWTTDLAADSTVHYGPTNGYGQTATAAGMVTAHSVPITGLTPGTYHFQVVSTTAAGGSSSSPDGTFVST